ncbi:MAG TPA: SRPBCC family protein [Solirubrobacteraceae bacterium]|nr:SRPBCC family protein [Solirubrobacteraceae bacterium]
MRQRLSDRIHIALPAEEAFQLFTPNGEREWAGDAWDPRFPAPTSDDSEPGTVFETTAHGRRTTWVVTERVLGRRIAYAQVMPGERAGSITVTLDAADGGSEAEVVYELTPLSDAGADHLKQFADAYGDFLRSWEDEIAACLEKRAAS